jgi:hypothetical protein
VTSHEQKEALRDQEAPAMPDVRAVRGESLKVEWRGIKWSIRSRRQEVFIIHFDVVKRFWLFQPSQMSARDTRDI